MKFKVGDKVKLSGKRYNMYGKLDTKLGFFIPLLNKEGIVYEIRNDFYAYNVKFGRDCNCYNEKELVHWNINKRIL